MLTERRKWGLISLLVIAWATNLFIPLFVHDYKSPPESHIAFMTVIGILAAQKPSDGGNPPA